MGKLDKPDNNLDKVQEEQKQEKETKDSLLNFGKGNEGNDEKLLNNPQGGNKVINAIKEDIIKKHIEINEKYKEVNDIGTNKKIEELVKNMDGYTKLGKLNKEQAKELSEIYKEIISIFGTEHAEDAKNGEEVKESREKTISDYSKKLLDATEKLDKFLKTNHEEAMNKQKQNSEIMQEARKNQKEQPSAYASLEIPPSQKESPTATA